MEKQEEMVIIEGYLDVLQTLKILEAYSRGKLDHWTKERAVILDPVKEQLDGFLILLELTYDVGTKIRKNSDFIYWEVQAEKTKLYCPQLFKFIVVITPYCDFSIEIEVYKDVALTSEEELRLIDLNFELPIMRNWVHFSRKIDSLEELQKLLPVLEGLIKVDRL